MFGYIGAAGRSDVKQMQQLVQQIATSSRRPDLMFTLTPKFADGIVGPGTAKGVSLALRQSFTAAFVRANVASLTQRLLKVAATTASRPAPSTPQPSPRVPIPTPVSTPKQTKVLTDTKVSSGVIPITSDSYLKFFPGGAGKAPGYIIYKKMPGKKPVAIGNILVLVPAKRLKTSGKTISASTAIEMRKRIRIPWNTYSITLNGKLITKGSKQAITSPPPPVSPFVPSAAPPDAVATDYVTPKTPMILQKIFSQKQPPPRGFAPKTRPPDPRTSDKKIKPKKLPKVALPSVPESEQQLERFFSQPVIAGSVRSFLDPSMMGAGRVWHRHPLFSRMRVRKHAGEVALVEHSNIDGRFHWWVFRVSPYERLADGVANTAKTAKLQASQALGFTRMRGEFIYDTRQGYVAPIHWQSNPTKVEILSGHDSMDDADEELSEMQESGFSKGWW